VNLGLYLHAFDTGFFGIPILIERSAHCRQQQFVIERLFDKINRPAFIACTASGTSACPVMMMIGMSTFISFSRRCSSSPSMPGIRTSLTMQPG
jgi:hypothetical protein